MNAKLYDPRKQFMQYISPLVKFITGAHQNIYEAFCQSGQELKFLVDKWQQTRRLPCLCMN